MQTASNMEVFNTKVIQEKFIKFDDSKKIWTSMEVDKILSHMEKVSNIKVSMSKVSHAKPNKKSIKEFELQSKDMNNMLIAIINDTRKHMQSMGFYGGSKSVLLHTTDIMKKIQNMNKNKKSPLKSILEYMLTELFVIRKLIEQEMQLKSYSADEERITLNSSPKILNLFDLIECSFNENDQKQLCTKKEFSCLIFVDDCKTAIVLFHVLKNLTDLNKKFEFLVPDYFVECSNDTFMNSSEPQYNVEWSKEALYRFNHGNSNCLIITDAVHEDLDISNCSIIIRYDAPKDFKSYTQSKNRAKNLSSQLVFILENNDDVLNQNLLEWKKMDEPFNKIIPEDESINSSEIKNIDSKTFNENEISCKEKKATLRIRPILVGPRRGLNDPLETPFSRMKNHRLIPAAALCSAYPLPNLEAYLHIIDVKPNYVPSSESDQVIFNNFKNKSGYAILSSKELPTIPAFPIFMTQGKLTVNIKVNHRKIFVSPDDINKLKLFHWLIFKDILNFLKDYMIFDNDNLENSFMIVPVNKKWQINWNIVEKNKSIVFKSVNKVKQFEYQIIALTNAPDKEKYIVTKIYYDLSPLSPSPIEGFTSYFDLYKKKYKIDIQNLTQPMLETKIIPSNMDFLMPSKQMKRSKIESNVQILIPELCSVISFPVMFWLKATYLPSVLYRITQLLVADDLRQEIVRETGLGRLEVSEWPAMEFEEKENLLLESKKEEQLVLNTDKVQLKNNEEIDTFCFRENILPWSTTPAPIDLYRNIDTIKLKDIELYYDYDKTIAVKNETFESKAIGNKYTRRLNIKPPTLDVINLITYMSDGPSPLDIMTALTTAGCSDMINLERLETLGDSFLKYIVSAYIFMEYPDFNEGYLTLYKSRIVGNSNLLFCAECKRIPGRMNTTTFVANEHFRTPSYCVPKQILQILNKNEITSFDFNNFQFTKDEQFSGELKQVIKEKKILQMLKTCNNEDKKKLKIDHINEIRSVKKKNVSDSVEALLATYLRSTGVEGATKLLLWLGVLDKKLNIEEFFYKPPISSRLQPGNPEEHMPWINFVQNTIGYTFKDPTYLLEAFTHGSYTNHSITKDYQRLEFLGDAVIDFLITLYIFDYCGNLNPGELTDLRSALVNNIIFACLTVKYGLQIGILYSCKDMTTAIQIFVDFQAKRNNAVNDNVIQFLLDENNQCYAAEYIEVPKILGDIFESLIGAIYLDSGKDLNKVWEILYGLMKNELENFSKNVPKQPTRCITELTSLNPKFLKSEVIHDERYVMVPLQIEIGGKLVTFYGFGTAKPAAKSVAAKLALKYLKKIDYF